MDFVDQDIDTESLKDLSAQIEASKKTLKSNNAQIAQLRDQMAKAKEEDRFQDAAIAQNGIEVLVENNKTVERSIEDTQSLMKEREAQNADHC